jgi:hypothetical protein
MQENRAHMDRYERMYQDSVRRQKELVDAIFSGLRFIAPMTPIRADDAAVAFLEDIRTPGAPVKPTPLEVDKAIYDPVPPQEKIEPFSLGGGTGDKP